MTNILLQIALHSHLNYKWTSDVIKTQAPKTKTQTFKTKTETKTHYQKLVNILHAAQHGFLKRHSTATNLLECFNDWTVSIQDKN